MNIFAQKYAKTTIKMLDFAHEIGLLSVKNYETKGVRDFCAG